MWIMRYHRFELRHLNDNITNEIDICDQFLEDYDGRQKKQQQQKKPNHVFRLHRKWKVQSSRKHDFKGALIATYVFTLIEVFRSVLSNCRKQNF